MSVSTKLDETKCTPCQKLEPLSAEEIKALSSQLHPAWEINTSQDRITRRFSFKNFSETIGFVNAVAWIARRENHHPEITLGFSYCIITFTTQMLKHLSKNDFICAAKIDKL